jgi:hypothetical protein
MVIDEDQERSTTRLTEDMTIGSLRPCGHTLTVFWVPTVKFYENRLQPLVRLEDEGSLLSFQVTPQSVGARLAGIELSMDSKSLKIFSAGPLGGDACASLLRSVLDAVQPKSYRSVGVALQYVVPLADTSYDDARLKGLQTFADTDFQSVGANDFAVIVSGEKPGMRWNVEAGIIEKSEIPGRMLRQAGGFRGVMPGSDVLLESVGDPEVAFFADSYWVIQDSQKDADAATWILDKILMVEEQADLVVPQVFQAITHQSPVAQEGAGS